MIREALDAFIKPKTWEHDRSKTVGSSEIGQCSRRVWYIKNDQKPDANHVVTWGASERGTMIENNLLAPAMKAKYGNKYVMGGADQKTFENDYLSATPDGLLLKQPPDVLKHLGVKDIRSNEIAIEFKTIDPRVNLTEEKHVNKMQVIAAMGLIRDCTKYKPNYALLSYTNASFLDDISEYAVEFDAKVYKHLHERADMIMTARKATDLKPEGYIGGGKECEHCPFAKACGIERHNLPNAKFKQDVDKQTRAEFVDLVRNALALKLTADEASGDYKDAQEEIRERLREKNLRVIPGLINWQAVKGRTGYDYEKLKVACIKKGIDIEKFSTVGDPTSRLVLSDPGDDV